MRLEEMEEPVLQGEVFRCNHSVVTRKQGKKIDFFVGLWYTEKRKGETNYGRT